MIYFLDNLKRIVYTKIILIDKQGKYMTILIIDILGNVLTFPKTYTCNIFVHSYLYELLTGL